jgi:hypothetical protein
MISTWGKIKSTWRKIHPPKPNDESLKREIKRLVEEIQSMRRVALLVALIVIGR